MKRTRSKMTALKSENLILDIEKSKNDTTITNTKKRVSNVIIAAILKANVSISFDAPVNLWMGVSLGTYPNAAINDHSFLPALHLEN